MSDKAKLREEIELLKARIATLEATQYRQPVTPYWTPQPYVWQPQVYCSTNTDPRIFKGPNSTDIPW